VKGNDPLILMIVFNPWRIFFKDWAVYLQQPWLDSPSALARIKRIQSAKPLSLSLSLSLSLIKLLLPLVDVNGSEWYTYKPTDDVDVEVQM